MRKRRKQLVAGIVTLAVLALLCYFLSSPKHPPNGVKRDANSVFEASAKLINLAAAPQADQRLPANDWAFKKSPAVVNSITNVAPATVSTNTTQNSKREGENDPIMQPIFNNNNFSTYQPTWGASLQGTAETTSNAFNFISAYYDGRSHPPSVVVLGYQLRRETGSVVRCLLQYNNTSGTGTAVQCIESDQLPMDSCNKYKETNQGELYPYVHLFYVCKLSNDGDIPVSVAMSLTCTGGPLTPSIQIYNPSNQSRAENGIGICIQTPVFKTGLDNLVSFIEMNKLLGVELFTMYYIVGSVGFTAQQHSILNFLWEKYSNILDIVGWSALFYADKTVLHYHGEILAINDCLFRYIGRVKYLVFTDLDELIFPKSHDNLKDMLADLDPVGSHLDSFIFRNVLFLESKVFSLKKRIIDWESRLCCGAQLPKYLFHFNRVKCYFKYFTRSKLIVKPLHVKDMDIHSVCQRVDNTTTHMLVPEDIAVNHHYRIRPTTECHKSLFSHTYDATVDTAVADRFADKLIHSINTIISL